MSRLWIYLGIFVLNFGYLFSSSSLLGEVLSTHSFRHSPQDILCSLIVEIMESSGDKLMDISIDTFEINHNDHKGKVNPPLTPDRYDVYGEFSTPIGFVYV